MKIKNEGHAAEFQGKRAENLEIGKGMDVDGAEGSSPMKDQELDRRKEEEQCILKRVLDFPTSTGLEGNPNHSRAMDGFGGCLPLISKADHVDLIPRSP
jgi:hypothetical protein